MRSPKAQRALLLAATATSLCLACASSHDGSPGSTDGGPSDGAVSDAGLDAGPACPADFPGVVNELELLDGLLAQWTVEFEAIVRAPEDVEWVRTALAYFAGIDQAVRLTAMPAFDGSMECEDGQCLLLEVGARMLEVDASNTAEVDALLDLYEWFTISVFGAEADRNGWIIVQHADANLAFQKEVLAILEGLYPVGETNPQNYAYLYDRVAVAEGRLQRYGTQWTCVDGSMAPLPIEDPETLDTRRAEMGLKPMAETKERMQGSCGASDC